jgi:hypothetical protein
LLGFYGSSKRQFEVRRLDSMLQQRKHVN